MDFIMAIENDTLGVNELEGFFQGLRQRVVITRFSPTVMEYIKSSNPDIILVGLTLKEKRELQFVMELKEDPITKNMPILALIPNQNENFIFNHKLIGFTDYMIRPLERQSLLSKIEALIGDFKRANMMKSEENPSHILVERSFGRTVIQFKTSLKKFVLPQIKKVFTPIFLKAIQTDRICIDIRALNDLDTDELKIIEKILPIFGKKKVSMIAGRHIGMILAESELEEQMNLFMAPNEFEEFIKSEDAKEKEAAKKAKHNDQQQSNNNNQKPAPAAVPAAKT